MQQRLQGSRNPLQTLTMHVVKPDRSSPRISKGGEGSKTLVTISELESFSDSVKTTHSSETYSSPVPLQVAQSSHLKREYGSKQRRTPEPAGGAWLHMPSCKGAHTQWGLKLVKSGHTWAQHAGKHSWKLLQLYTQVIQTQQTD